MDKQQFYVENNFEDDLNKIWQCDDLYDYFSVPKLSNSKKKTISDTNCYFDCIQEDSKTCFYIKCDESVKVGDTPYDCTFKLINNHFIASKINPLPEYTIYLSVNMNNTHEYVKFTYTNLDKLEVALSYRNISINEGTKIGNNVRIGDYVTIGANAIIGDKCEIGWCCNIEDDVIIGDNVILRGGNNVGCKSKIEDETEIDEASEFGGGVKIGKKNIISKNVKIGNFSIIGSYNNIGEDVKIETSSLIENNIFIGFDSKISHRCKIASYVHIYPKSNIEKYVIINENAIIGKYAYLPEAAIIDKNADLSSPMTIICNNEPISYIANSKICFNTLTNDLDWFKANIDNIAEDNGYGLLITEEYKRCFEVFDNYTATIKKSPCRILILDIETTGFLEEGGSIVEIGIVELNLMNGQINVIYDSLLKEPILDDTHKTLPYGWIFQNSDLSYNDLINAPSSIEVLKEVQAIINKYPGGVTAYNNKFDFGFLEDRGISIPKKLSCPMLLMTDICKIPSRITSEKYKWPNCEEAYNYLFPESNFIEAHRAIDDALHEAEIVYQLYLMRCYPMSYEDFYSIYYDSDKYI